MVKTKEDLTNKKMCTILINGKFFTQAFLIGDNALAFCKESLATQLNISTKDILILSS